MNAAFHLAEYSPTKTDDDIADAKRRAKCITRDLILTNSLLLDEVVLMHDKGNEQDEKIKQF